MVDETEDTDVFQDHTETRSCTRKEGESSCHVCLRKLDHSEISATDNFIQWYFFFAYAKRSSMQG